MTLTGMNIGEIRSLASQLQRRSDAVADSARVVDRLVQLTRRNWYGDDIAQFESRWNGGTRAIAERVATELRELAETARRNADDQERTSNELGGGNSGGSGTGSGGGGDQNPFSWVGDGLDWLGDRVEDGLDWAQDAGDWVADRVSDAWDWTTDRVDDAWNWTLDRVDDVANFVVPRVEAGLAGWDRFVEALGANAQAWNFFDGHPPQLSEVLAAGVLALGTGIGTVANVVTGQDHQIFDPGTPGAGQAHDITGDPATQRVTDFTSLTAATMSSYEHNGVRVDEIVGPDGETRYIVSVPGTQAQIDSLAGWSQNPNGRNWAANLWAMAQGSQATDAQAVAMAIQNAGVPDGASILLTGHSQGGLIAANLAADHDFAQRYAIDGVITYGAPVENADLHPGSAPVLALGHGNTVASVPVPGTPWEIPVIRQIGDPVPQLDFGGAGVFPFVPAQQGSITTIDLPPKGDSFFDMTANHEQAGYLADVQNLSAENQAAIDDYLSSNNLDAYLNGTTTSTVTVETTG